MTLPIQDIIDIETCHLHRVSLKQLPVESHPKLSFFQFLDLIDEGFNLQSRQLPADRASYSLPVELKHHQWGLLTAQALRKGHREIAEFIFDQYRIRLIASHCGLCRDELPENCFYGAFMSSIEKDVEPLFLKMVRQFSFSQEQYAGALCLAAHGGNFKMVRSLMMALPPKAATPAYLKHALTIAVSRGHVAVLNELKRWSYVYADHFDDLLQMQPSSEMEDILFQMVVPHRSEPSLRSSAKAE